MKRKVAVSKQSWQEVRARYTWHSRPPFKDKFDRTHWWKGPDDSEINEASALYELARRHPLVGRGLSVRTPNSATREAIYAKVWGDSTTCPPIVVEARLKPLINEAVAGLREPPSLYWTCLLGLKSWAKLSYIERRNWESNVGNLKGLDFRCAELQCRSINQLAHWKIIDERKAVLRKRGQINDDINLKSDEEWEANRQKNLSVLHNDLAVNPPTTEEWEAAIAYRAVEAHRQGFTLLAVAPDLKADKAASVMVKTYHDHLHFYHPSRHKQRARWEDWLDIISEFENDEANPKKKAKSQVFVRYRRALDGIHFA